METVCPEFMNSSPLSQRRRFSRGFRIGLGLVLLLAAAAGAAILYLRLTTPPDESTYIPRTEVVTPEVQLLQQYIRIDTSNPPGNEMAGARFLLQQLQAAGIEAELIETAPNRANVYARLRGKTAGQGLLLLHHIDVVPAEPEGWTRPPFAAEIFLNQVWGRGALDMKAMGIANLLAFIDASKQPDRESDVVFLATADEEIEGKLGMAWLLRNRPDIFEGIRFALNEGGITEVKAEKLAVFGVEIGSKTFMRVELSSPGRESLEQARIALEPYVAPSDPDRLLPEIRDYFQTIAPYRWEGKDQLRDVEKTIAEGRFWFLNSSFRSLTQNNIHPLGIRSAPEGFVMDVILHNLPDENPAHALGRLRSIVRPFHVRDEVLMAMPPTRISPGRGPFFERIERAVHEVYGSEIPVVPQILPYQANDSRYLRAAGIEAYGISPYLVDFHQSQGIHANDERIRLDWFAAGIDLTKRIVAAHLRAN